LYYDHDCSVLKQARIDDYAKQQINIEHWDHISDVGSESPFEKFWLKAARVNKRQNSPHIVL
jgi:hypothetical protein